MRKYFTILEGNLKLLSTPLRALSARYAPRAFACQQVSYSLSGLAAHEERLP